MVQASLIRSFALLAIIIVMLMGLMAINADSPDRMSRQASGLPLIEQNDSMYGLFDADGYDCLHLPR